VLWREVRIYYVSEEKGLVITIPSVENFSGLSRTDDFQHPNSRRRLQTQKQIPV
jgi:hypothetical protein